MKVDIYIGDTSGGRAIRIPWLPDEIKYTTGEAIMASYDIMNKGEVAVPTGVGLFECSWESIFPGEGRKTSDCGLMRGIWQKPETYHNTLENWKQNRTKLNLMVIGYPINKAVYIVDYEGSASGGFGDITYSVKFKEAENIIVSFSRESARYGRVSTCTQRTTAALSTITVKSGDTLWKLAKQHLGSGSKWTELYKANKTIIEETARKHGKSSSLNGHWIYPGTSLVLPTTNK